MGGRPIFGLLLALAISGFLLAGCLGGQPAAPQGGTSVTPGGSGTAPLSASAGRAVMTITDKAADMGTVTSIMVTVSSVQLHSSTGAWINANITPKTYDLLKLKAEGLNALLADFSVPAGSYDQLRLDISKVVVVDATGSHDAKLPSGTLRIMSGVNVSANSTSAISFDFIADESLHMTGNGLYILAPVVQVESRENAEVDSRNREDVKVGGGRVHSQKKVGMDISGRVDEDARIPRDANLTINANDDVEIEVPGIEERAENAQNETEIRIPVAVNRTSTRSGGEDGLPFNASERMRVGWG